MMKVQSFLAEVRSRRRSLHRASAGTITDAPWPAMLDPEARYLWEERAAILEHDAGYATTEAERLAWQMLFTNSRN